MKWLLTTGVLLLLGCGFTFADTMEFTRADDFTADDGTSLSGRAFPTKVGTLGYASAGNSWNSASAGWAIKSNRATITSAATGADQAMIRTPWYSNIVAGVGDTFTMSADITLGEDGGTFLFGYSKSTSISGGLLTGARGCYSIDTDGTVKFYRVGTSVAFTTAIPNYHPEWSNHFDIIVTAASGNASTIQIAWQGYAMHAPFTLNYAITELWYGGVLSNDGVENITKFDNFAFTNNVPEPATAVLLVLGAVGTVLKRRKTS